MLRRIIFFAIHQPLFVFLLLALFVGAGIFAFKTLPIEAFPDVTDIQVTVTRPVNVGFTIHPGDQIQAQGSSYGSSQIVENFYDFTSTAQAPSIQSQKTVTTAVGIYPQQLAIPQ